MVFGLQRFNDLMGISTCYACAAKSPCGWWSGFFGLLPNFPFCLAAAAFAALVDEAPSFPFLAAILYALYKYRVFELITNRSDFVTDTLRKLLGCKIGLCHN
jgi:hypothetical protein